ncbi:MAG: hypothetical protein ABW202_06520 [Duganella sp.]
MDTKLTVKLSALVAAACMSASVLAQTPAGAPQPMGQATPQQQPVQQTAQPMQPMQAPSTTASQAATTSGELHPTLPSHAATQTAPATSRAEVKTANAQRSVNVNCVDGPSAAAPRETAAHAGKHDNALAKADCNTRTMQR